ncbi:MAG: hypothetical protein LBB89_10360 [Treponema sp.]|jgi:hypothetical protein|nr:hypothetical protein [Treponema sp.]
MREYTGDHVLFPLRKGWASNPDTFGTPQEPPIDEYTRGAVPLQTLPAPYHNWFTKHLVNNSSLTAEALADIYGELDAVLVEAGISPDAVTHDQLVQSIKVITERDTSAIIERISTAESNITSLDEGKVDKNTAITGATKTKITYDAKGLVTAGANLEASDIPDLDTAKITTGTFADARIASATTWNGKAANTQASLTAGSGTVTDTPAQTNPTAWGMIQSIWDRLYALATWKNGLAASTFSIKGIWTCPTPSLPS